MDSVLILLGMAALVVFAFWNASKCQSRREQSERHDLESENFEAIPLDEEKFDDCHPRAENFSFSSGDVGSKIWEDLYYANENYHLL